MSVKNLNHLTYIFKARIYKKRTFKKNRHKGRNMLWAHSYSIYKMEEEVVWNKAGSGSLYCTYILVGGEVGVCVLSFNSGTVIFWNFIILEAKNLQGMRVVSNIYRILNNPISLFLFNSTSSINSWAHCLWHYYVEVIIQWAFYAQLMGNTNKYSLTSSVSHRAACRHTINKLPTQQCKNV